MKETKKLQKIYTECSLKWSLKIGEHLGTLNKQEAAKLAHVKPVIFHRWLNGKLAAPSNKLEKIKHHAFCTLKSRYRKIANAETRHNLVDEELIRARYVWKNMIFDQLKMVAKRRFCANVKRTYSKQ